ncbi:hypothetical protein N473_26240 [Pseudoalteromonas luteoviolacea CPMOR-1]|uniref:Lipoprotein n=1 Tax=Pseudoalteromonas luteoviolacea CPMOR-1 TaxID=1365248 RepID=A0A167I5D9_9GAMM|nr:hypothetical protein N473_26240 [Pseudoalteromonas luteoviolacea CPMOR-1]
MKYTFLAILVLFTASACAAGGGSGIWAKYETSLCDSGPGGIPEPPTVV